MYLCVCVCVCACPLFVKSSVASSLHLIAIYHAIYLMNFSYRRPAVHWPVQCVHQSMLPSAILDNEIEPIGQSLDVLNFNF